MKPDKTKVCAWCAQPFQRRREKDGGIEPDKRWDRRLFCGRRCSITARTKRPVGTFKDFSAKRCVICDGLFTPERESARTCSRKCWGRDSVNAFGRNPVVDKICELCRCAFSRRPAEKTAMFRKRRFCGPRCKYLFIAQRRIGATNARGPITRDTSNRRLLKMVEKRKCSRCDNRRELQYHHINRNWRDNRRSNIEVVCARCHAEEHREERSIRAKAVRKQQILSRRDGQGPQGPSRCF